MSFAYKRMARQAEAFEHGAPFNAVAYVRPGAVAVDRRCVAFHHTDVVEQCGFIYKLTVNVEPFSVGTKNGFPRHTFRVNGNCGEESVIAGIKPGENVRYV